MDKTLVVYFSKSGNTRRVATKIAQSIQADICEIKMKKDNTSMIGDMLRTWADPLLPLEEMSKTNDVNVSGYDHIYIGTPVWGFSASLPIKEFVRKYDFSGKKVSLFCTHDGGPGSTISSLEASLKKASIDKSIKISSGQCYQDQSLDGLLKEWLT